MKNFLLALLLTAVCAHAADYGVKTRFEKNTPLKFPDCELTFTGTRRVTSSVYPRGFVYYDFTAKAGGKTSNIEWSEGTGLIGPKYFSVGGRKYVLELKGSASFKGFMKENELVLWKQADFDKIKR